LHRPWSLEPEQLPPDIGVLAYHQAFDDRLTLGYNPRLAAALGMLASHPFGMHKGRVVGMLGTVPPQSAAAYVHLLHDVFGGSDAVVGNTSETNLAGIAVMGALSDALVREAASRGAQLYVTGQLRAVAEAAVAETGITVVAIGHRRSEAWGLRALAGVLRERWASLTVLLA
jgi:putative NIF3 family GTP cyclohydrolase 1 type 2